MKHEWDYQTGGKTSVRIHNAPGKLQTLLIFHSRWQQLMEHWLG